MQCVILNGGLGKRMFPLTNNLPKCMIEVNGIPFINYQLRLLSEKGIKDIVLCVGYLNNIIKEYVKDGSIFNLKVDYVEDGDILLGTGGAIKKAYNLNKLHDNFFVMYGDSFLPISSTPSAST